MDVRVRSLDDLSCPLFACFCSKRCKRRPPLSCAQFLSSKLFYSMSRFVCPCQKRWIYKSCWFQMISPRLKLHLSINIDTWPAGTVDRCRWRTASWRVPHPLSVHIHPATVQSCQATVQSCRRSSSTIPPPMLHLVSPEGKGWSIGILKGTK